MAFLSEQFLFKVNIDIKDDKLIVHLSFSIFFIVFFYCLLSETV